MPQCSNCSFCLLPFPKVSFYRSCADTLVSLDKLLPILQLIGAFRAYAYYMSDCKRRVHYSFMRVVVSFYRTLASNLCNLFSLYRAVTMPWMKPELEFYYMLSLSNISTLLQVLPDAWQS